MLRSLRRVSLLAVSSVLAVGAAGCMGSSQSSGGGASTSGVAGVNVQRNASDTLDIMGFGAGDEVAQARTKLAAHAIAPAKVHNPSGGFQDQQFLTRVASGNVPDLIYIDRQKVGEYAAKGELQPLTSCIQQQGIDMSQYRQPAVDEVTYNGTVYGIPEFYDNRVLMINGDLVRDTGSVTTSSKQELQHLAQAYSKVSGGKVDRIGFDPKLPEFFPLWVKMFGGSIISADGKTAQLDSPAAVKALQFAVSLIEQQGGWGPFSSFRNTFDFFGGGNEFARNQLGAFPMEDWYLNVLAQNSPQVNLVVKPVEALDGSTVDWETGSAWAIPKGAKHPQLACLWAKTITSVKAWIAAAKARLRVDRQKNTAFTGLYTANQAADRKIMSTYFKPTGSKWSKAVQTVEQVQGSAFGLPASPAGAEFQNAWQNAINRVLAGQQSVQAALTQAQHEAQSALDAAGG